MSTEMSFSKTPTQIAMKRKTVTRRRDDHGLEKGDLLVPMSSSGPGASRLLPEGEFLRVTGVKTEYLEDMLCGDCNGSGTRPGHDPPFNLAYCDTCGGSGASPADELKREGMDWEFDSMRAFMVWLVDEGLARKHHLINRIEFEYVEDTDK